MYILSNGHWIADPGYIGTTAITPERKPKNSEFSPKTKVTTNSSPEYGPQSNDASLT